MSKREGGCVSMNVGGYMCVQGRVCGCVDLAVPSVCGGGVRECVSASECVKGCV